MGGAGVDRAYVVSHLASTPILESLDRASVEELCSKGRIQTFPRNSYLFHEGDPAREVYFLLDGKVEICTNSTGGRRQLYAVVQGREFIGELAVLARSPRTATAKTVEDSTAWALDGEAFVGFLEGEGKAATELLRMVVGRLLDYKQLAEDLVDLDLRGRVAKHLIRLACGEVSRADAVPDVASTPPVTQSDLAASLGASRENITRVLTELQRRSLVERDGKRYVLKDVPNLRSLASVGPEELCRLV